MIDLPPNAARQYIDAVSAFTALEEAEGEASAVNGGMYWHKGPAAAPELSYLVRTSTHGAEKSLGPRTPDTQAIYDRFIERKRQSHERVAGLKASLKEHERMNRALRVGRVDPLVVEILRRLAMTGLAVHFRVVGTHALYAYEAEAGARFDNDVVATRDIDLLWDIRKRVQFATDLDKVGPSMLGVLQKVDASFRLRQSQKYTAVNQSGFEVDILRRERDGDDPHPVRLSNDEDDFWVTQARNANQLMNSPPFSAVIVATNGAMARMNTLHPLAFARFKRWMAGLPDREPLKRRRDALQADRVAELVEARLPHLSSLA